MAESVVSFVLDQLSAFLREEGRLMGGLQQEVQLIRDELGHMRAFLKAAEAKEEDDSRLQEWIKQVQEAAYDAEDVLDEFVFLFARQRSNGFYGSVMRIFNSIKNLRGRHRVAGEIQSIKARIKHISEGHQRYQSEYRLSDSVSGSLATADNTAWRYSRDDALLVEEQQLVGINKPKYDLISQLLEGDSQFKVITVVGMGGLGKTTLVKKVFDDADVRKNFLFHAWVTVSQTCDFQQLLKSLIRQLHVEIKTQLIDCLTTFELKEFVKEFLQQGRYLIVFDDVWDVEFCNAIKYVLPSNCCSNRIMLTTRIEDVASASCLQSQGSVYKMKPLSYEESWTLFCDRTFEDNCCPDHLKNVAGAILEKCEGLPLAIVAISGLLAVKDVSRIGEWEIVRLSLGRELEGTGKLDRLKKILHLSCSDLASHLKICMLYLCIFPEDYKIQCARLIQLWIAESFVERREGMTIEDVAWDYLRELGNRNLIQVIEVFYEGIPNICRIHDLLREVTLSMSRKQNMVTIRTGQYTRWPDKVRRLVINNFLTNSHIENHCFDNLRSIIGFGSMEPLSKALLSNLLSSKLLTIPKSIGKLRNLEYLNVGETEVRELPMEILKLQKLHHLWVFQKVDSVDTDYGYYGFNASSKMSALLALQALDTIDAENDETSGIVKEIGKLTQLRLLGITNLTSKAGKELCSSIDKLTNLRELDVTSTGKDEVIDFNHSFSSSLQSLRMLVLRGRLQTMPQWITCLQGLVRLVLIWSGLSVDILGYLQHLPSLIQLNMRQAFRGEGLCFKAGSFLKLRELYVSDFEGLRWMRVDEGAMPRLQQLTLQQLPLLERLPLGIQDLKQLQKLILNDLSSQLIDKLENQDGEDYQQIAHIPEFITFLHTNGKWRQRQLQGKKRT